MSQYFPAMPANPFQMPILDSNTQAWMLSGGGAYQPPTRSVNWPGLNLGASPSPTIPGVMPTGNPALPTGGLQPGSIPFIPPSSMPSTIGMVPRMDSGMLGGDASMEPIGLGEPNIEPISLFDPSMSPDPFYGLDYGNAEGAFTGGIAPDMPPAAPPSGYFGQIGQGVSNGASALWDALSTNMGNAYDPVRAAADPAYAAAWTTTGDAGGLGHQMAGLLNMGVMEGGSSAGGNPYAGRNSTGLGMGSSNGEGGSGFVSSTGLAGGGLIDPVGSRTQRFRNPFGY